MLISSQDYGSLEVLFTTRRLVRRLTASLAMSYGSSGRVVAWLTRSALGLPAPPKLELPTSGVSLKRSRTMAAISREPPSAPIATNPPFKRARVLTRPILGESNKFLAQRGASHHETLTVQMPLPGQILDGPARPIPFGAKRKALVAAIGSKRAADLIKKRRLAATRQASHPKRL